MPTQEGSKTPIPSWASRLIESGGAVAVIVVVWFLMIVPLRDDIRETKALVQKHNDRSDIHDDTEDKNTRIDFRCSRLIAAALRELKIPPDDVKRRLDSLEDSYREVSSKLTEVQGQLAEILRRLK